MRIYKTKKHYVYESSNHAVSSIYILDIPQVNHFESCSKIWKQYFHEIPNKTTGTVSNFKEPRCNKTSYYLS